MHLTRIYTRTGDSGTSRLADGTAIAKTDPRLVAYADCDETNAALGAVLALGHPADRLAVLVRRIQNELFDVGADLATPVVADPPWEPLRVDPGLHRPARSATATCSMTSSRRSTRSSCPAASRPPRCCIWRARSHGAPNGRAGRW